MGTTFKTSGERLHVTLTIALLAASSRTRSASVRWPAASRAQTGSIASRVSCRADIRICRPRIIKLTELAIEPGAFQHRAGDGPEQPAITSPATAD